jgi:hypothetical protein
LESETVLRALTAHSEEVQNFAERARALKAEAAAPEQAALRADLARDLDHFVQTIIQEISRPKA